MGFAFIPKYQALKILSTSVYKVLKVENLSLKSLLIVLTILINRGFFALNPVYCPVDPRLSKAMINP